MSTLLTIAVVFSALNLLVLAGLTAIWVRNYREFGTPLILGLIVFGVVLLLENATAIYYAQFTMDMFYAAEPAVHRAVAILRGMQFVALCFLGWATWQ